MVQFPHDVKFNNKFIFKSLDKFEKIPVLISIYVFIGVYFLSIVCLNLIPISFMENELVQNFLEKLYFLMPNLTILKQKSDIPKQMIFIYTWIYYSCLFSFVFVWICSFKLWTKAGWKFYIQIFLKASKLMRRTVNAMSFFDKFFYRACFFLGYIITILMFLEKDSVSMSKTLFREPMFFDGEDYYSNIPLFIVQEQLLVTVVFLWLFPVFMFFTSYWGYYLIKLVKVFKIK